MERCGKFIYYEPMKIDEVDHHVASVHAVGTACHRSRHQSSSSFGFSSAELKGFSLVRYQSRRAYTRFVVEFSVPSAHKSSLGLASPREHVAHLVPLKLATDIRRPRLSRCFGSQKKTKGKTRPVLLLRRKQNTLKHLPVDDWKDATCVN